MLIDVYIKVKGGKRAIWKEDESDVSGYGKLFRKEYVKDVKCKFYLIGNSKGSFKEMRKNYHNVECVK